MSVLSLLCTGISELASMSYRQYYRWTG